MADLKSLIAELEQAKEGSRKLDIAIHELITGERVIQRTPAGWVVPCTTSVDAALTLVPEGEIASVSTDGHASIVSYNPVTAATPALALCIAVLKVGND